MITCILIENFILNSDFTIILPIMRIKTIVKNVDWIFLKMTDQSYFANIVLIMHNKCSQANIARNCVNLSKALQRTRTNLAHSNKQMAERNRHILSFA